jgi:RNA 2',3'-cyclic 3'-phosphodiesterase
MTKLFAAVDLPPSILLSLQSTVPDAFPGVRVTGPDQLHLTLHYIGESDLKSVRATLQSVVTEPLPLVVRGIGRFDGAKGSTVVWAGVETSEALTALHQAVADTLATAGFTPETRPYFPHITLAWCDASVSRAIIDSIAATGPSLYAEGIVESFTLYSSEIVDGRPRYNAEAIFPLRRGDIDDR